jgi:hypothetical protein
MLRKSQISEEEIKSSPFVFTDPSEQIIAR